MKACLLWYLDPSSPHQLEKHRYQSWTLSDNLSGAAHGIVTFNPLKTEAVLFISTQKLPQGSKMTRFRFS